jgi:hypothetical protein
MLVGPAIVLPATSALAEVLPTALPKNASDVNDKFQPAMDYDTDGCYPTPAVGVDGEGPARTVFASARKTRTPRTTRARGSTRTW